MAWGVVKLKKNLKKILICAIALSFFIAIYLGIMGLRLQRNTKGKYFANIERKENTIKIEYVNTPSESTHQHRLTVLVPFRDRFEELLVFGPFIHRFLNRKKIQHDIVVVNQIDTHRFNRASLINAGFLYATTKLNPPCDYIVMHDVDLLPLNNKLPYEFPEPNSVTHVAAPGLHPKYNYPTFIGGILVLSTDIFKIVNGMSNIYWGWGLEDDEFYVRLKQNKIQIKRPTGLETNKSNTFRHTHNSKVRSRDTEKCFDQWNKTKRRDRRTGLNNLNYTLVSVSHMMVDEAPIIILNVKLQCDVKISPWCDCNKQIKHNTTNITKLDKSYKHKRRKI